MIASAKAGWGQHAVRRCALLFCSPFRSLLACGPARAQEAYPSKPVRMIVPFAAGRPGRPDRTAAWRRSSPKTRQAVLHREPLRRRRQSRHRRSARARRPTAIPSDRQQPGHRHQSRASTRSLPYDPFKDFVAVTRIATTPNVVVVHPSVPAKTVEGAGRLIREQRRQVPRLCASRPRHAAAPVRRAVPADAEPQAHLDPVRRRRPDDPVGGRRPHADRVLVAAAGGRRRSRPARCARSPSPPTSARQPARRADHGRGRLSRSDRRDADRAFSCRPARRRRSSISCTARWWRWSRRRTSRRSSPRSVRADRRHAGGVRGVPQGARTRSGAR